MEAGNAITILFVEDDEAHAEITLRNLSTLRIINNVFHVNDGQKALDYLKNEGNYSDVSKYPRPDLILLDLRLPKVDGIEVLNIIKEDPKLQSIPVVIMTTSDAENDIVSAYSKGAGSYLVKPMDFDKLVMLMESFGYYWVVWNKYPHKK